MQEIKVPFQGEVTEYVTITKWTVGVGDEIKEGDEIGEMESDKTVAPIVATCSGKVAELVKAEGDEADVGEVIMLVED